MRAITSQPRSFYLIFLLEIWERYGFYTLQTVFVAHLVGHGSLSDARADILFTSFAALAYLLPAVGGWIGDQLLGTKRTIVLGAICLLAGYFVLTLNNANPLSHLLVIGLALVAVGNGLFKPNPSSLLSKVYERTQNNPDSGFTLYYMAINIGGLIGAFSAPWLDATFGWRVAFGTATGCIALVLINYYWMYRFIANVGSAPDQRPLRYDYLLLVCAGILGSIALGAWLLDHAILMRWLLGVGTFTLLAAYVVQTFGAEPAERPGMWLFLILFAVAVLFFALLFQLPTSLTLFAMRNIEPTIFGFITMEPAQYQGLESFWILIMSPVLAAIYQKLAQTKHDVSLPAKFSIGVLFMGLAFLILPFASLFAVNGQISGLWLVLSYWFQAVGELLISALGFSVAAQFVPQRLMGYAMGIWLLSISIGNVVAGIIASLASIPANISHEPSVSLPIYNHVFLEIGVITLLVSFIMFTLIPKLKRLEQRRQ